MVKTLHMQYQPISSETYTAQVSQSGFYPIEFFFYNYPGRKAAVLLDLLDLSPLTVP